MGTARFYTDDALTEHQAPGVKLVILHVVCACTCKRTGWLRGDRITQRREASGSNHNAVRIVQFDIILAANCALIRNEADILTQTG